MIQKGSSGGVDVWRLEKQRSEVKRGLIYGNARGLKHSTTNNATRPYVLSDGPLLPAILKRRSVHRDEGGDSDSKRHVIQPQWFTWQERFFPTRMVSSTKGFSVFPFPTISRGFLSYFPSVRRASSAEPETGP